MTEKRISISLIGLIFTCGILCGGLIIMNFNRELDRDYNCYISHVQECLRCHEDNLTYSLCSGFCFPPRESDLNNSNSLDKSCIIHPLENCWDLPKDCNLD